MVLEATVICVDNSDWMRNGDYNPTRLEAQHDAVNLLCNAKTQSNPENTVGIVACAGKNPEVLDTLTGDIGKVLTSLHEMRIGGSVHLSAGIQVAQLVLKHRQNKNQQQRIIFFVGSPIEEESESLVRLGKRLKKNNISLDLVNFGEEAENTPKLEALLNAVNNGDNSHLVTIPPGPHILSDLLISSPLIAGGGGMGESGGFSGSGAGGGNPFEAYGGIDPSLDPELALALKMSMDEERARQEARDRAEGGSAPEPTTPMTSSTTSVTGGGAAAQQQQQHGDVSMTDADEDDDLLRQALAMSMPGTSSSSSTGGSAPATTTNTTSSSKPPQQDVDMDDDHMTEEQEIALAMQMSMAQQQAAAQQNGGNGGEGVDLSQVMDDPNFVNSVLASLPGVDPNDDRIKSLLQGLGGKDDSNKKDDKDKK